MKVLIADDEKLVCFSMESMLNELGIGSGNIVKCFNGEEFLEKLTIHMPDIAFVDIKMPKINGIEAIERGKVLSPNTKYYILTSFPEFDYAKKAIDMGVSGYLLKPLSLGELKEVLQAFRKEERESLRRANTYFENLINALFNKTISIKDKEVSDIQDFSFMGMIVTIDSAASEEKRSEYQVSFFNKLRKEFESFVYSGINYAFSTLDNGYPVIVFGWDSSRVRDGLGGDVSCYIRRRLERAIVDEVDYVPTFIIANVGASYNELIENLGYLKNKGYVRCILGIGRCLYESSIREIVSIEALDMLGRRASELVDAYNGKRYLDFSKIVDALNDIILTLLQMDKSGAKGVSFLGSLCHFFRINLNTEMRDCERGDADTLKLIEELKSIATTLVERRIEEKTDSSFVVEEIKNFVDRNYMNNIGIAQIAYKLNLTPNYLSALFHKKTGKTFINYLTDIRIEKAKEFLIDPSVKVCDVARRVGYYSTRYFSKVFKRKVGVQPSEYNKLFREK